MAAQSSADRASGWRRYSPAGRRPCAGGEGAVLSHRSAAELWGIRPFRAGDIHVSVPLSAARSRSGIVVHRRSTLGPGDLVHRDRITVTGIVCTLIELATSLDRRELETAVNEADRLDLIADGIGRELDALSGAVGGTRAG